MGVMHTMVTACVTFVDRITSEVPNWHPPRRCGVPARRATKVIASSWATKYSIPNLVARTKTPVYLLLRQNLVLLFIHYDIGRLRSVNIMYTFLDTRTDTKCHRVHLQRCNKACASCKARINLLTQGQACLHYPLCTIAA